MYIYILIYKSCIYNINIIIKLGWNKKKKKKNTRKIMKNIKWILEYL